MPPPPSDAERSTGLLVVAGPIADGDVAKLCERLRAVIAGSDAQRIVSDVSTLPASAGAVEALARLQLTARRLHRHVRLQRASPGLEHLLQFVGLADVLAMNAPLGGRRRGNAEQREHPLGVQKAVDRDDPSL